MNKSLPTLALCAMAVVACGKKNPPPPAPTDTPAPAVPQGRADAPVATVTPAPTPAADPAPAQRERAEQLAKLDYATMEDSELHDPHGQWAESVTATSVFGDDDGKTPSAANAPANMAGPPDGKTWTNNHQDMGFDAITATFTKPVQATEVRVVCTEDHAVASISKIELQGTDDSWHTAWSGLSESKPDTRGPRSWFIRSFPKTAHAVKAVRITFANAVASGYKVVDAVQLVGE